MSARGKRGGRATPARGAPSRRVPDRRGAEPEPRDASLRVSRRVRDSLKASAALLGRPLYEVTNEAIEAYLSGLVLADPLATMRRSRERRKT